MNVLRNGLGLSLMSSLAFLVACNGGTQMSPPSAEVQSSASVAQAISHISRRASEVSAILPNRVLYSGGCLVNHGGCASQYAPKYGVFVFDATKMVGGSGQSPLYQITHGIDQNPTNSNVPVAVDDSGNLYAVNNGQSATDVVVYASGQKSPKATLSGLPQGLVVGSIAVSALGEVALQVNPNGAVYIYSPGASSPSRSVTCDSGSTAQPGAIGYLSSGTLEIGIDSPTGSGNLQGTVYPLKSGGTKCGKPVAFANPNQFFENQVDFNGGDFIAYKKHLWFLGRYQPGAVNAWYFPAHLSQPLWVNNGPGTTNSVSFAADKLTDLFAGAGSGAIQGLCNGLQYVGSLVKTTRQCTNTFFGGSGGVWANSAAVYPRLPLASF